MPNRKKFGSALDVLVRVSLKIALLAICLGFLLSGASLAAASPAKKDYVSYVIDNTPYQPTTLIVQTTPVSGEVFVNSSSWGMAPQSRRVNPGTYTVSFGDVSGYYTPAPQTVTLAAGEQRTVTGTYVPIPPPPPPPPSPPLPSPSSPPPSYFPPSSPPPSSPPLGNPLSPPTTPPGTKPPTFTRPDFTPWMSGRYDGGSGPAGPITRLFTVDVYTGKYIHAGATIQVAGGARTLINDIGFTTPIVNQHPIRTFLSRIITCLFRSKS